MAKIKEVKKQVNYTNLSYLEIVEEIVRDFQNNATSSNVGLSIYEIIDKIKEIRPSFNDRDYNLVAQIHSDIISSAKFVNINVNQFLLKEGNLDLWDKDVYYYREPVGFEDLEITDDIISTMKDLPDDFDDESDEEISIVDEVVQSPDELAIIKLTEVITDMFSNKNSKYNNVMFKLKLTKNDFDPQNDEKNYNFVKKAIQEILDKNEKITVATEIFGEKIVKLLGEELYIISPDEDLDDLDINEKDDLEDIIYDDSDDNSTDDSDDDFDEYDDSDY
ncbi:MAG: hypothetical protein LBV51_00585 [Acholeplasmatales bacterium]|jgi:hypothetical protein|nr:hypothetical protein [Acholeplasmatales bacterium]